MAEQQKDQLRTLVESTRPRYLWILRRDLRQKGCWEFCLQEGRLGTVPRIRVPDLIRPFLPLLFDPEIKTIYTLLWWLPIFDNSERNSGVTAISTTGTLSKSQVVAVSRKILEPGHQGILSQEWWLVEMEEKAPVCSGVAI